MLLSNINLVDRIQIPSKRVITDAGQMIVPCAFARTGSQLYTAKQLGLVDREPNEIIAVHREASDVFAEDSMDTFRSAPVTVGHPKDADGKPVPVTIDNASELQVGMLEGRPHRMEDTLAGVLVLSAKPALDALEDEQSELSAGYTCDIEEVDGKFYQRNIRANHIAIVKRGRAGSSCRISDDADEVIQALEESEQKEFTDSVDTPEPSKEPNKDAIEALALMISDSAAATVALQDELSEALAKVKTLTDEAVAHVASLKEKDDEIAKGVIALDEAIKVNEESVFERCEVIDAARFIADMKGFGDKSTVEIKKLVIADQMPELSLEDKDDSYVAAIFDMVKDQSEKQTPMHRLMSKHINDQEDAAPAKVDKVAEARKRSIERNSGTK